MICSDEEDVNPSLKQQYIREEDEGEIELQH
jgi:hypothetical protein